MHHRSLFAGMLVTGLLLTSGLSPHSAHASTLQPFKYTHTTVTETTELIGVSEHSLTDLLSELQTLYGTHNTTPPTWLTDATSSTTTTSNQIHLSTPDSSSSSGSDESQPGDPVTAGTDGTGGISGGVVNDSNAGVTTSPQPIPQEEPLIYSATTLRLSELYPNTNNDLTEEFVELHNIGSESVSLAGWTMEDASGKRVVFNEDTILEPNAYVVVERAQSKLALNNELETLRLSSPNGTVIDEVTYNASTKESTLSKIGDQWVWTTERTPGAVNSKPAEIVPVVEPTVSAPIVEPISAPTTPVTPIIPEPIVSPVLPSEPVNTLVVQPVQTESVLPVVKTLRISEVYPNTLGDDLAEEFIEIENTGSEPVSLQGWTLMDASEKSFLFSDSIVIEPFQRFIASRSFTKLSLNNDADSLVLTSPDGDVIDQVSYSKTVDGSSLSFVNGSDVWTTPTPGTESILIEPAIAQPVTLESTPIVVAESPQVISSPENDHTNASAQSSGTTSINDQADGSLVNVEGQVLVTPGVLGKQIFYVNVNGQGIQVYKNDAVFPLLQEGQLVRINGEMSTSREERRIKVTSAGSLEPLESVSPLQATNLALSTINATAHGQFISTQGMIVSRSATEILLEDQGTQLVIGISDYATIDTTVFNKGDLLRAQGIVVSQTGSLKLKPRSQDDLEIIAQETPAVTTATISGKDRATSTQQKQALLLGLGTGVVLLAYALRKYHPKFNSSYVAKHALPLSTQTIR